MIPVSGGDHRGLIKWDAIFKGESALCDYNEGIWNHGLKKCDFSAGIEGKMHFIIRIDGTIKTHHI